MAWETFRRVVSLTSIPAGAPSFLMPNKSSPALCLLRMAAMEFRPSLSSARLFFELDGGLADGNAITVFEVDTRILAECSLFRGFAFFASAALFPVDVGAIEAAEIAK